MSSTSHTDIRARKRWALVAGFAVAAVIGPLFTHGTESGNVGWAWFAWFALNALFAAFTDVYSG